MSDYNDLITNYCNDYSAIKTKIDELNKKVNPLANPFELKEVLGSIIKEDYDYVRRYLKNSSNIVFQKDFKIDRVAKWLYKGIYNNDSEYYTLIDKCILLSFNDYALYSSNFSYYVDIFVDGVKLNPNKYIIRASNYSNTKFYTGMRRIFIRKEAVKDGSVVSVVVKKYRNQTNFYKNIKIEELDVTNNKTQYKIQIEAIGDYLDRIENLVVYKKLPGAKYFRRLEVDKFNLTLEGNDLLLNILEDLVAKTCYLVMNKTRMVEYTFTNTSNVSREEYIEHFAVLNIDLVDKTKKVDGAYLPIPVDSTAEVECFVNGLRLVPDLDFSLVNDSNTKGQHIHLAGILEQDAYVVLRNKNFSDEYSFYKQYDTIGEIGLIDLSDTNVPISEDYVECYLCRKRVALCDKRSAYSRMLKIDSQNSTRCADVFPEFEISLLASELLTQYRNDMNKNILGQLYSVGKAVMEDEWKQNNPINENEDGESPSYTEEIAFTGKIKRIKIELSSSVVYEGQSPDVKVYGFFDDADKDIDEIGIDITDYCEINQINPYIIGEQQIVANYVQAETVLTDTASVVVSLKELVGARIVTSSNFYVIGDNIKNTINVIATFADTSEKNITDICTIDCKDIADTAGYEKVKIEFVYDGRTVKAEKTILVSETSERKITNLDIVLDNYLVNETQTSAMSLYATYSNNMIQKLDKNVVKVYIMDDTDPEDILYTEITNIDECHFNSIDQDIKLKIEVYTNERMRELVEFIDNEGQSVLYKIATIRVLTDQFDDESRYVLYDDLLVHIDERYVNAIKAIPGNEIVTYSVKNINNETISLGTTEIENNLMVGYIPDGNTVIVEFYNTLAEIISQKVFRIKNVNATRETITGQISGDPINGYIVTIDKFLFGKELSELSPENISLLDNSFESLCTINTEILGGDSLSEDSGNIYIHFNNMSTKNESGNVKKIADYIDSEEEVPGTKKLYLDSGSANKLIDLTIHSNLELQPIEVSLTEDVYIDRSNADYYLVFVPKFNPTVSIDNTYVATPNNVTITKRAESEKRKVKLLLQTDTSNSIFVPASTYGFNIYYFVDEMNKVCYELNLCINMINDKVRIISINSNIVSEIEYNSIPVKYHVVDDE